MSNAVKRTEIKRPTPTTEPKRKHRTPTDDHHPEKPKRRPSTTNGRHPEVPPARRQATRRPQTPSIIPRQPAPAEPQRAPTRITQAQAFLEVVRRANDGSEYCEAGMRQILDGKPEIWRSVGDVGALAERSWIDLLSSGNKLAEESIRRRQQELKASLGGDQATPLEKLLIDVAGITWLAAQHGEITAANASSGSLQQAAYRLKRAESAQRRFLSAVKTLAKVRALLPRQAKKAMARKS